MERTYDLFEVLPDGAIIWVEMVPGHVSVVFAPSGRSVGR
jgi:hypothetical protein